MKRIINVYSEISSLKKVLLYRPGNEFLNITPDLLDKLSFNGIPYLKNIQKEYDRFINILHNEGVDVVYLIDLVVECLNTNSNIREKFIKQFIKEAKITIRHLNDDIYFLLSSIKDNRKLIYKCIEGIRKNEINLIDDKFYSCNDSDFIVEPLPNLYFIRYIFCSIGNGVVNNIENIRMRESIFMEYIIKYHPTYKNIKLYYERYDNELLNTRDILVLNNEVVCIGISNNTNVYAITKLAEKLFDLDKFKYILAIDIKELSMYLDDLISMIDYDKFIVSMMIEKISSIYELTLNNGKIIVTDLRFSLDKVLEKYLRLDKVTFIKCGNGDIVDCKREEWNNGVNVLCIKPGVVLTYNKNELINQTMKELGVKVIEIPCCELSKGNGGLHNMCVPLIREK